MEKEKKIKQPLMRINVVNKNNRIYSKEVIEKAIKELNERPKHNHVYGEVGIPHDKSLQRQMQIDPLNISHLLDNFRIEDDVLYADMEVAWTEKGKIMQGLIDNKAEIKLALRGQGQTDSNGNVTELKIVSFDWITDNSDPE